MLLFLFRAILEAKQFRIRLSLGGEATPGYTLTQCEIFCLPWHTLLKVSVKMTVQSTGSFFPVLCTVNLHN
jgi:hypothetical protein